MRQIGVVSSSSETAGCSHEACARFRCPCPWRRSMTAVTTRTTLALVLARAAAAHGHRRRGVVVVLLAVGTPWFLRGCKCCGIVEVAEWCSFEFEYNSCGCEVQIGTGRTHENTYS